MAFPGPLTSVHVKDGEARVSSGKVSVDPERSLLMHGYTGTPADSQKAHPLEQSEKTYAARMDMIQMGILKQTQGMHAPLRLMMERDAADRVSRLPFLPSSRLMRDVLDGRDEDLGPEAVFNDPMQPEVMGTPQLVMERSLNLM